MSNVLNLVSQVQGYVVVLLPIQIHSLLEETMWYTETLCKHLVVGAVPLCCSSKHSAVTHSGA